MVLAVAMTAVGPRAKAQEPLEVPISHDEFLSMISSKTPEDVFSAAVHRRGVSFSPRLEDLEALRAAGYSPDLMLIVARSSRPFASPQRDEDVEGQEIPVGEEESKEVLFFNFNSASLDRDACLPAGLLYRSRTQLEVLETLWASLGGPSALDHAETRVRLAFGLVEAGFPVAACYVLSGLPKEAMDSTTGACVALALDRIGASLVECTMGEGTRPLLQVDPSDIPTNVFDRFLFFVGRELFEMGPPSYKEAKRYLRSVRRESADFPRARFLLALIAAHEGDLQEALRLFSTLTGLTGSIGGVSISDLAFLNMARVAYDLGHYEDSLSFYRRISTGSRLWSDATYERAWTALAAGHYGEALGAVVALRSPLVRPRQYHDGWVVEVVALMENCLYDKALRWAKVWGDVLEQRLQRYAHLLPGVIEYAEGCRPQGCPKDTSNVVKPDVVIRHFPGIMTDPALYALYKTARAAKREERTLLSAALGSPVLVGLDNVAINASEHAWNRFHDALAKAVSEDIRKIMLSKAKVTEVLSDLDSRTLDALYGEVKGMVGEAERLPFDRLARQVEAMARRGASDAEIKLFLATRARGRAFSEHEIETLRHAGASSEVLDFIRRFFAKPKTVRFEVDPAGEDPRILWGFEGEFWTDEITGFRVELENRCRSLVPQLPPGLR